jgi:hypothetical protein
VKAKAMTRYDLQSLIPHLLEVVPEIRDEYEAMRKYAIESHPHWIDQDYEDMLRIAQIHNLPKKQHDEPGITLVVEDLLVPHIIKQALDTRSSSRLHEIMKWVEGLANSDIFDVKNLVAASICQPMITTFEDELKHIYPYMGKKTKELCRIQLPYYNIRSKTKRLFEKD